MILAVIAAASVIADPALERRLCADAATACRVESVTDAGTGQGGAVLRVALVAIENAPDVEDYAACRPARQQYWILKDGAEPVVLLDLCNDGYGASGVGEDDVKIEPNRLTHAQYGGSALRWVETNVYRLDPLATLSTEGCGFHALTGEWEMSRWDWTAFRGEGWASSVQCGADGEPTEDTDGLDVCDPESARTRFVPIPSVSDDGADAAALASAELGSCAASVESSGRAGFVVFGQAGDAADASFRATVIGSPDGVGASKLIVDVRDDTLVPDAERWIHADHLEIWAGGYARSNCMDPDTRPTQWGVLMSGDVKRAAGPAPEAPVAAKVERRGEVVRYVVEIPSMPPLFTVLYSDSDDGRSQERLIATSTLRGGQADSFGAARPISATQARCGLKDGRFDAIEAGLVRAGPAE